ncbi:MAG: PD-(D/E)XK nuclease family protein [Kiritimatiellae bacterium]|nr:PD-(D/E)XK nuclease family protein [Kiritimatiellia bacterium]
MKEMLTATRMATVLACPRKHYWRYEVGLHAVTDGMALRFGTAWHATMEGRWQGLAPEDALLAAVKDQTFDEITVATLVGLLGAYYARYADAEVVKELHAEVEFRLPLAGSRTFDAAGKIDGLGVLQDGRLALVEHKTCGTDIASDSDYWLRLRFNQQVYQYVLAARALGWDVQLAIYDVTRKPAIRQKQGETASEFGDRLAADAKERPEFYFARREVPILDQDLAEFEVQRLALSKQILFFRAAARSARRPEHGWPRNCGEMTCKCCEFERFCMANVSVDVGNPPAGFRVGAANPELAGM